MTHALRPKVSVIIPVYKAEEYIEKCAESLFSQTLEDIEYIFVDDCSPDNSIEVMRQVLSRFPSRQGQVRVLRHDKNMGVSQARQDGVDAAKGEYLIHCDPDDWVEPTMYERMYQTALFTKADIVLCDYIVEMDGCTWVVRQTLGDNQVENVKKLLRGSLHCATWNKLVRVGLYKDRDLRFPIGIDLWEDVCVTIQLVLLSKTIVSIAEGLYHYRQINTEAYTRSISKKSVRDILKSVTYVENCVNNMSISEFSDAIRHRKIVAKLFLLNNTTGDIQRDASLLYPELGRKVLEWDIPIHSKIGLWLNQLFGVSGYRFYNALKTWVSALLSRLNQFKS